MILWRYFVELSREGLPWFPRNIFPRSIFIKNHEENLKFQKIKYDTTEQKQTAERNRVANKR